jgi:hypothetical protein
MNWFQSLASGGRVVVNGIIQKEQAGAVAGEFV